MKPVFIPSSQGRIFGLYHPPQADAPDHGDLIFVPPFAEELNRSRHVVATQARDLAARGCGVLILDLFGTGDSDGDFADGRWDIWLDDIAAGARWLRAQGRDRIGLWGLRLGATLAVAAAGTIAGACTRLVLWQPVTDGRVFLTQFLRIKIAADMARGQPGPTTSDLRAALEAGETIEVAGYDLGPDLAQAIDALRLAELTPPPGCPVAWFELVTSDETPLSRGAARVIETWRQAGHEVTAQTVVDAAFWTFLEREWAPRLVAATTVKICGAGT